VELGFEEIVLLSSLTSLATIIVGAVIFHARESRRQSKGRAILGRLERRYFSFITRGGVIGAVLIGFICIGLGVYLRGETNIVDFFKEWSPHFGPELVIIGFATLFIDGAISRSERRKSLRFRTVQRLLYFIGEFRRNEYFLLGNIEYLRVERSALERRQKTTREVFWLDELELLENTKNMALKFIDMSIEFSRMLQIHESLRRQIMPALRSNEQPKDFQIVFESLEEDGQSNIRRIPTNLETPIVLDDIVDAQADRGWSIQLDNLKYYLTTSGLPPKTCQNIAEYFDRYHGLLNCRVRLINTFISFKDTAYSLRDTVWEKDDPDE
jgi:hypothetical protein